MTERERWIVYPLLFLALGAALRDKVIKTTQSQRIKCQGLYVVDKDENPLLILGAEQFPELRVNAPDLLHVDRVTSKRYVVTEGSVSVQVDTRHAVIAAQLLDWVQNIVQRLQAVSRVQGKMRPRLRPPQPSVSQQPEAEPPEKPPAASPEGSSAPPEEPATPPADPAPEESAAGEPESE